jgi:hypothetical protein
MTDMSPVDQERSEMFSSKDWHVELQKARIDLALEEARGSSKDDTNFVKSVDTSFDSPVGIFDEWEYLRLLKGLDIKVSADNVKENTLEGKQSGSPSFLEKWHATSDSNLFVVEQTTRGMADRDILVGRQLSIVSNAYKEANNLH